MSRRFSTSPRRNAIHHQLDYTVTPPIPRSPITTNWNAGHTKITGYTTNTFTSVTTNTTASISVTNFYSFATNVSFYDYREGKTVAAVQLNVGALTNWLNSTAGSTLNSQVYTDTGHYIDSVYVYNNAPYTSTSLPAVRMANGSVLPDQGLTVVTPDPLYVLGNYNANGSSSMGTTTRPTPSRPPCSAIPLPPFPPAGATAITQALP